MFCGFMVYLGSDPNYKGNKLLHRNCYQTAIDLYNRTESLHNYIDFSKYHMC